MSAQSTQKPVCAVVGVGPGNGAAFARRFAAEGYAVALLARSTGLISGLASELPVARAYACDVGNLAAVERTFESIESDLGSVDVLIYNAGKGVWGSADGRICFGQGGPAQSCRIPRPFARAIGDPCLADYH